MSRVVVWAHDPWGRGGVAEVVYWGRGERSVEVTLGLLRLVEASRLRLGGVGIMVEVLLRGR
jgi:hypothetical protein